MKTFRTYMRIVDNFYDLCDRIYWHFRKLPEPPPRVERPPYDGPPVFREKD